MTKSISVNKKSRGRPKRADGVDPVMAVRLPQKERAAIVKWAEQQPDMPSLSQAVRRLVKLGLTYKPSGRAPNNEQKARASEMAGAAIDRLGDTDASFDDKATRKRRLLKGPEEFRDARVDRTKRRPAK